MEHNDRQGEFYDLSGVLDEAGPKQAQIGRGGYAGEENMPGIYRLIFWLSGGIIKTKGQALVVAIIFLILINAVTLMLASGKNGII